MSDNKIEEIRDRHERVRRDGDLATPPVSMTGQNAAVDAHDDRNTLLDEVDRQRAEIERLRAALRWYADPRNHFPVERRNPGDPEPAVILIWEPPIMGDSGSRARNALEGKP